MIDHVEEAIVSSGIVDLFGYRSAISNRGAEDTRNVNNRDFGRVSVAERGPENIAVDRAVAGGQPKFGVSGRRRYCLCSTHSGEPESTKYGQIDQSNGRVHEHALAVYRAQTK